MSNSQKTPDFDKANTNFYVTPIKKKKIDFNYENYKNLEKYEDNNQNNLINVNQILNLNLNK